MWGKWCCNGKAVGLLKKRVSMIFGLTHAHGGNYRTFDHLCSGFGDSVIEYCGGQGQVTSLSNLLNMVRRGISSSRCVSGCPESGGGFMIYSSSGNSDHNDKGGLETVSLAEAKKLLRLVNVEALKERLGAEGKEAISYSELLEACQGMGVARNNDEAAAFARILDEAGVLLLFRDKVYLHPEKVKNTWQLAPKVRFIFRNSLFGK